MTASTMTALAGWGLYLVSLFLRLAPNPENGQFYRGYVAILFGWFTLKELVTGPRQVWSQMDPGEAIMFVVMPLTNVLLWATVPWILSGRAVGRLLPGAMLLCALINSSAPFLDRDALDLREAYYVWAGSFWCVTAALILRWRDSRPAAI